MSKETQMIHLKKPEGTVLGVRYYSNPDNLPPFLHAEFSDGIRRIPVLSVRDPNHDVLIARHIVSGELGAFEVGVMGILKAVPSDPSKDSDSGKKFWEVKRGRGSADKVPMMMLPEHHDKVVDYDKVHPAFSYLKDPTERQKFFGRVPFHAILPLADGAKINSDVFVTTVEDSNKKPLDQQVSEPTVCIFFPGGDKAWTSIATIANLVDPNVHLGISSLNDHGEQSPYDLNELIAYVNRKQKVDFDFVVHDPIVRNAEIKSSHTQIRLPLRDEHPEILVVRKGPISADTIRRLMGHPVRELASAKVASRGHPEDLLLDDRVFKYLVEADYHFTQS